MAFTAQYLPVQRLKYFTFFATDGDSVAAPNATFTEDFNPSFAFEIDRIRLRLFTPHVSVVDFMMTLSHHQGSLFNQNILSYPMLGVQDIMYQPNMTLLMHSNDVLRMSLIISAVNIYGLEISGWAVTQPSAGWG